VKVCGESFIGAFVFDEPSSAEAPDDAASQAPMATVAQTREEFGCSLGLGACGAAPAPVLTIKLARIPTPTPPPIPQPPRFDRMSDAA
jgi:hypothetical protein